jgi:flagellar assembly protein FliH
MDVKQVEYQTFHGEKDSPEKRLARAIEEAERLISDAHAQADRIQKEAYEKGFAQGEQAGVKMGLASAQPSADGAAALVEQLNTLLLATLEAMEPEIIRLVQLIAERVIQTKIAADDEILVKVVRAAMAEVDKGWAVTVRVNPTELETLRVHQDEFSRIAEAKSVTLTADESIEPGGCRIITPGGFVDASVRLALSNLFRFEDGA